jgi:hypothetical protein
LACSWPWAFVILAIDGQNPRVAEMGAYSIAEAKDRLSSLVKQAEDGEDVAITRQRPAAERPRRQPSHELVAKIV